MNTTTLNMTTLDGGVIIKKGGGGCGVTINNQDKVVDITENGTTEVVADGGFTGLGKVTINTKVSGGESGGSTIEYFVYDKGTASAVATYAQYVKLEAMEGMLKAVMPYSPTTSEIIEQMGGEIKAFGVNLNDRVSLVQGDVFRDSTILETLAENGITREKINTIPRLTKEQFYSLD